jgi:hypothetical protein
MTKQIIWTFVFLSSLLTMALQPAHGQDAFVTFYSHGVVGFDHDVYTGNLFDGTQGLFSFLDSHLVHNNRYLTLRLAPGPHIFGASNGKGPKLQETLDIDLRAGQHYFIRAQAETRGVPGVFVVQHGRLDLISCTQAQTEMIKAKPLTDKALWRYAKARRSTMVVDGSQFPPCS